MTGLFWLRTHIHKHTHTRKKKCKLLQSFPEPEGGGVCVCQFCRSKIWNPADAEFTLTEQKKKSSSHLRHFEAANVRQFRLINYLISARPPRVSVSYWLITLPEPNTVINPKCEKWCAPHQGSHHPQPPHHPTPTPPCTSIGFNDSHQNKRLPTSLMGELGLGVEFIFLSFFPFLPFVSNFLFTLLIYFSLPTCA